jgi:hypothetical protein
MTQNLSEHAAVVEAAKELIVGEGLHDYAPEDLARAARIVADAVAKVCGERDEEVERLRTSLAEAIDRLRDQDEIVTDLQAVLWTTGMSRKAALNHNDPTPEAEKIVKALEGVGRTSWDVEPLFSASNTAPQPLAKYHDAVALLRRWLEEGEAADYLIPETYILLATIDAEEAKSEEGTG